MKFFDLKSFVILFALWTHAALAGFYPMNGGMVNQATVITAAAGTTTLSATSNQVQIVEGATTQTIKLPDATLLPIDWWYEIVNNSTGNVTVTNNAGTTLDTLVGGQSSRLHMTARASAAGTWKIYPTVGTSEVFTKSEFISTSAGAADGGKPVKTNGSGQIDDTMLPASSSNAWSKLGNDSTTAGTNFLGTTDSVDLVFKTNATERFRITSGGNLDTALSTGIAHLNASGVISSSAVDLASSDVTGILPNANTTADAANTASAIVTRDGSGNFAAGTITAALTGTASGNTTYTPNQYGVVLSGAANAMSVLAPNASTAFPLVSGGASANPSWALLTVAGGGTGASSLTDHGLLVGGGTGAVDAISVGGSGTLLQGTAGSDPAFTLTPVLGVAGASTGTLGFSGSTSGTVTVQPQAAAGTYNFNLPTSAGTSGQALLSGGGGSTAMTFGTLGVAAGGTGQTSYTDGQLLIGNSSGNTLSKATLTAGSNITITNGNGTIEIAATGSSSSECYIERHTPSGHGSTGTRVRTFTTTASAGSCGLSVTASASNGNNGDIITVGTAGKYCAFFRDSRVGASAQVCIAKGLAGTQVTATTSCDSVTGNSLMSQHTSSNESVMTQAGTCMYLPANTILDARGSGSNDCSSTNCRFRVEMMSQ